MRSTATLRILQSTSRMLFRPSARALFHTSSRTMFRPSSMVLRPLPKEDQAGHTISQRLRKLKDIPMELIPLAVVIGFAIFAAISSVIRKFMVDKNLRLHRQGPAGKKGH